MLNLETLTLAGWHPDAGVWPMLIAVSILVTVMSVFGGRK